jgi:outer membrane protein assembly factor BamB
VRSQIVLGRDGSIYFNATDGLIYSLDQNGKRQWTLPAPGNVPFAYLQRPLQLAYTVLQLGPDGTIYASASPAGDFRLFAVHPDGTLRWTVQRPVGLSPAFGVGRTRRCTLAIRMRC